MTENSVNIEMVNIRKFRCNDLKKILEIEKNSFMESWIPQIFQYNTRNDNSIFLVAEKGKEIIDYIISVFYRLNRTVHILNLAVENIFRR
jgi:ribosomal protein S18 acetylase RimI-like enzyme